MDNTGWTWIFSRPTPGVIDQGHPDYEYWREAAEIDAWIADGAPPLDPDGAQPVEQSPAEAVPIHLQLAVTKEQAGALLGERSVDWIEDHVLPHVATVKPSRSVLIPMRELERWIAENSGMAL